MKVMTIVGARPQFVKAAVVSRAFREYRPEVTEVIVHTGQHFDSNMSEIFFEELEIPMPTFNLGIGGGSHGQNTGRMLEQLEGIMIEEKPDWVMVYGDTDSTLAGALAASKLQIRIAHVEAGLRSFNRSMPEEINRVVTDHISDLLLVPTSLARKNLIREGVDPDKIKFVGDVMHDASIFYKKRSEKPSFMANIGLNGNDFVLATVHRAENTDSAENLANIFRGLGLCGEKVVLPLHPRTKSKLSSFGIEIMPNIHIVDPVSYLEMVWLEDNCKFISTDSGGVQKEAYFFKKFCKTMRNETEWVELVELGWNELVGTSVDKIKRSTNHNSQTPYDNMLYGDGRAGVKIVMMF